MAYVSIDIGHGTDTFPPDKGIYVNGKGYEEHDFNSKVAIELDKLLRANGIKTLMYQKPFSRNIGLTQRTNYYDAQGVDLVWSIHANASGDNGADGRCAFYWHTSTGGKRLANIYADEVNKAGYQTHGNGTHASVPGTWTNLHICREPRAVAVLTENGFMSNNEPGTDDDFELIFGSKQAQYVKEIARVHAKSICKYFGITFKDTGYESANKKEDELTMAQYEELQAQIDGLRKLVKGNQSNEPAAWAKSLWDEKVKEGYFDGTRPYESVARQELAAILERLTNNIDEYQISPLKAQLEELEKRLENK